MLAENKAGLLFPDAVLEDSEVSQHWFVKFGPLAALADAPDSFERLRMDAQGLAALPDILTESGLPDRTMNHPGIALKNLEQRLKEWDLK